MFSSARKKANRFKKASNAVNSMRSSKIRKHYGGGIFDVAKSIFEKAMPLVKSVAPVVQDAMKNGKLCIPVDKVKSALTGKGVAKPVAMPNEDKPKTKTDGQKLLDKYLSGGIIQAPKARKMPARRADDILNSLITGSGLNIL